MEYQYSNSLQINNMDYWSLVHMLMNQITPENRKLVLERLMEMNNQLMVSDLTRSSILNSRKKDVSEVKHPSLDFLNDQGKNPLPMNIPFNANNQYTPNSYQTNSVPNNYNKHQYKIDNEIDLDDIIEEIQSVDPLDEKLHYIKKLYTKIITEKRKRRKEREKKNNY